MSYDVHIPRCTHIKTNGTQCGSPALRGRPFCFFHKNWQGQRIQLNAQPASSLSFTMPVLEDADSVQVALMQVMRLILAGQLDPKIAGLLLYALQTASLNPRQMKLEPYRHESVVTDPRAVAGSEKEFEEEDADQDEDGEEEDSEDEEDAPRKKKRKILPKKTKKKTSPRARRGSLSGPCGEPVLSVPKDPRQCPVGSPEPTSTPSSPNSMKTRSPATCWRCSISGRRPESSEAGYRWRVGGPNDRSHNLECAPSKLCLGGGFPRGLRAWEGWTGSIKAVDCARGGVTGAKNLSRAPAICNSDLGSDSAS
jgi:hypothetical protein